MSRREDSGRSPTRRAAREMLVYLFLCTVWGSTWLAIRMGVRDVPPLLLAGLRMALAGALITPVAFAAARPTRRQAMWIAGNGLLQIGLAYALIFLAARRIESGLSALFFSTFPFWVGLFAHFQLSDEPWTRRTAAASFLGLSGVAVIEGPALGRALTGAASPILAGGALILAAAAVSGLSNVSVKKHLSDVAPAANVWGQTLVGALFLLIAAAVSEGHEPAHWTTRAIACLLYLALFGTALTFWGLFWLIPRVPVSLIGSIPLVDTLIAVLLGALVLHERLSGRDLAGGALIVLGVLLASSTPRFADPSAGAPKVSSRTV